MANHKSIGESHITTLAPEAEAGEKLTPELDKNIKKSLKKHIWTNSEKVLHPTAQEKVDTTTSEDVTDLFLRDDKAFKVTALLDISDNYSDSLRKHIGHVARKQVISTIEEMEIEYPEIKGKLKLNMKSASTAIEFAKQAVLEQDFQFETASSYSGTTKGTFAPQETLNIEIAMIKPNSTGKLEKKLDEESRLHMTLGASKPITNLPEIINSNWYLAKLQTSSGRPIEMYLPITALPENTKDLIRTMEEIATFGRDIEYIVGDDVDKKEPAVYYAFPSKRYVPRASAHANKPEAIVSMDNKKALLHERIHTEMSARYGRCFVGIMSEGATTYIEGILMPEELINVSLLPFNQKDMFKAMCQKTTIEQFSWTPEVIHNRAELNYDTDPKEFVYPFARLFAEFFTEKYSKDEYFKLYGLTSEKNGTLIDPKSGKTLVLMGGVMAGVTEDQILEAGLQALGIDPEQTKIDLYEYIKNLDYEEAVRKLGWASNLTNN